MNLLLVNPVHPSAPHISATRAWRFAEALAAMGHRVVLLTATPPGGNDVQGPGGSLPDMQGHDWREPLVLAAAPFDPSGRAVAGHRLLRKLGTAWRLLRRGGHETTWFDAAVTAAGQLAPGFRPDVIWTTFGRMEAVVVAREIARALRVPWVLDLKDSWEFFVPGPLRRIMARRVGGWSAITTNSTSNAALAMRWHGARAQVVYSGVDEAFLGTVGQTGHDARGRFVLALVGSIYFEDRLRELLRGIAAWSRGLPPAERHQVLLKYVGGDGDMFERIAGGAGLDIAWQASGYLALAKMAATCREAAVNMYVAVDGGFHHKLLELLASGRPVLCFPGEGAEARVLTARLHGELIEPADAEGMMRALQAVHRRWCEGRVPVPCRVELYRQFSWDSQARVLEGVLIDATGK